MPYSLKTALSSSLFVRWLPLILLCALVFQHFWFVYSTAVNIPYQDDVYDYLQFINEIETAESMKGAIAEWFRQYNDHRTGASRLLVYAAYKVEGEVNFHTHALLSNAALLLILFLFYLIVRNEEGRWIYVLVTALLLLNFRYYRLVLWGQAAFAFYFVFFYAFATLFSLHRITPAKFVLAVILCTLSTLTLASGQIVWLLGLVSLLHQSLIVRNKSLLYPAAWLLVAVVMLLVWRIGYTPGAPEIPAEELAGIQAKHPDLLIDPPIHEAIERYVLFTVVILGTAVTMSSALLAKAFGFFILVLLSHITVRNYKDQDIRLILCCWFVVASVAAVAVGRAAVADPAFFVSTNNRYSFFAVMLMCTLTLLLQMRINKFKFAAGYFLVFVAGGYFVWARQTFDEPLTKLVTHRHNAFNVGAYPVYAQPKELTAVIVGEAITSGRYVPPCRPLPDCEAGSNPGG